MKKLKKFLTIILIIAVIFILIKSPKSVAATVDLSEFDAVREPSLNERVNRTVAAILTLVEISYSIIMPIIVAILCIKGYKKKMADPNLEKKPTKLGTFAKFVIITYICSIPAAMIQMTKSFKPVIYLYPKKDENVKVKLGKKELLTCTYPKYEDEWNVLAKPNGDLFDEDGRKYYALYWEGKKANVFSKANDGFVVKGEDTAKFLEEKLNILGLNEREANEFIMYWLPQLEENPYNLIRFQTMAEIEANMPLDITPKPDTIIRVMMEYKPLKHKIEIEEQKLETPKREGFVAVEWGGTRQGI